MNQKQALFSFQGRMRRRDYWLYNIPVSLLILPSFFYLGGDPILDGLSMVLLFAVMFMSAALSVKRLRDRNKGPIWLLMTLLPIVGPVFALVELGILDGTKGPNRFGPDPKKRDNDKDSNTDVRSKEKERSVFEC